ncbi:hypothetical protein MesoLj131b_73580 (plasmid) [Mesorhizobium sp. 131-2-5]|nr:hypothetical protein MesoLj131b_73580 [Mesorhizobium sp. 131-2-5]
MLSVDYVMVDSTWYRLIPSRFPPISLYERVAREEVWPVVTSVEDLTNPRAQVRRLLTGAAQVDEASPKLQNWNHAPFTYLNPEGTWLLSPLFGAMELCDCLQTALAMSVRKRELFLSRTEEPPIDLDMRVLGTRVKGRFADLRALDPNLTQPARWEVGEELLNAGASGALFKCPDRPAGTCVAIFNGDVLARSVQAEHFRFVWDGHRIKSVYSFDKGENFRADDLFKETAMKAA